MDKYNRFNPYKILMYPDRVEKILAGSFPAPVVMHIFPSNRCPFNCSFCIMAAEKRRYPTMLKRETLFKAIREAALNGIKLIHFVGGGEPLTHPDIYEAIRLARKGGLKVAVSTNGLLMTRPAEITLADHLRISLDAGSPEMHQLIHQTPRRFFARVVSNIKKTVRFRARSGRKLDIGLGFVISPRNWTDIYNFCKVAAECKVDFVHIRPAYYPDKKRNEFLKAIIPSAFSLAEKARIDFKGLDIFSVTDKFDGFWTPRMYERCRSTPLQAVLTATGEFIVCLDVFIRFGNYNRGDFWQSWDSPAHRKALERIKLSRCPRCVQNTHNEIIQEVFMKNKLRAELI